MPVQSNLPRRRKCERTVSKRAARTLSQRIMGDQQEGWHIKLQCFLAASESIRCFSTLPKQYKHPVTPTSVTPTSPSSSFSLSLSQSPSFKEDLFTECCPSLYDEDFVSRCIVCLWDKKPWRRFPGFHSFFFMQSSQAVKPLILSGPIMTSPLHLLHGLGWRWQWWWGGGKRWLWTNEHPDLYAINMTRGRIKKRRKKKNDKISSSRMCVTLCFSQVGRRKEKKTHTDAIGEWSAKAILSRLCIIYEARINCRRTSVRKRMHLLPVTSIFDGRDEGSPSWRFGTTPWKILPVAIPPKYSALTFDPP